MNTKKVVIWGASGHAKVVADIIRLNHQYNIIGFLDSQSPERKGESFYGSTILGGVDEIEILLEKKITNIIMGFGDCLARDLLFHKLIKKGFYFINAIHPKSTIAADAVIGQGVVVCAGVVINSNTVIGDNVIVNTSSSIDHDCTIDESSHISPGVHLAGGVTVGKGTWIGIGSIVKEKITIGNNVIIGAGSLVLNDIPSKVLTYGSPAKIIKWIK